MKQMKMRKNLDEVDEIGMILEQAMIWKASHRHTHRHTERERLAAGVAKYAIQAAHDAPRKRDVLPQQEREQERESPLAPYYLILVN
tara:strand:- start:4695 stop:4955 length:261 start_codon:yes stop_codon:yes gene_type:complete